MPFTQTPLRPSRPLRLTALALATWCACAAVQAQTLPDGVDASRISPQVTLKLIDMLVKKGLLTRAEADDMIREAAASAPPAAAAALPYQTQPGAVVVPYIPEVVREQIKDELRAEVTQQAKTEGWATPGALPEWTQRITVYGDLRVRAEDDLFDKNNYPFFPNFAAINAGSGFDTVGGSNAPFLNTTEDRTRLRLRARLGVKADIADWIQADLRLATGSDRSPVSTNQTLGGGGNLSKESIWLDRASLRLSPTDGLAVSAGRFANPFWTTNLNFSDELNFDGVVASYAFFRDSDIKPWATLGFFPIYNTDFDFGSTDTIKTPSRDKWLYGGQIGTSWKFSDGAFKVGLGYFDYDQFEGKLSSPCLAPGPSDSCDTDGSRPQFQQFGNTLFAIRDIVANPANPGGPQLQYYGYASKFGVADLHAAYQIDNFDPFKIVVEGDVLANARYKASRIISLGPVNNLDTNNNFAGGNWGYYLNLVVGQPKITAKGEWNASLGYKHLESDAVPDGFTDSDFHLGGTNAQGFILGAKYGIARNTWLGLRWLSASEISGPPYAVDVVQFDVNSEF